MTDEDNDLAAHQVDDPEDFAQKQRLKQIYEARREFQQARAEAPQLRTEREWPLHKYQNHIYNAVQRYFFEVEGLMRRHPEGNQYLNDVKLGGIMKADNVNRENGERGIVNPDRDGDWNPDRAFVGLKSMAEKYRPMRTTGYKPDKFQKDTEDTVVLVTVPVDVSVRAYRQINKFLAEVGLDADMEGDTEEAEFDYSDILEEGPPNESEEPEVATDGGDGE
jgi:hypothetical protein